ncbi:MFS general substrate transporter [Suhomyces tanzawaensis NRRL Y-17324]|uniref:MFS general substrate transporter n=1 Tax=Suhomyces tanzawaensis NRRL Y-17324 TaxID=984487 RepID=A0A1E4SHA8_9ASCO|nr:MFS general substrate transporter [Suhomyces tanzawaensis NRRL Y-17324]ODV78876.1 MFS general substrate transporter [Suhomyces tanzawaensis NRRL Y-17324]
MSHKTDTLETRIRPSVSHGSTSSLESIASHQPQQLHQPIRGSSSSLESSDDKAVHPIGLSDDLPARRASVSTAGQSFQSLRTTSIDSGRLSRIASAYSVHDIYGQLDDANIALRRTASRTTILTTLSQRVQLELDRQESRQTHYLRKDQTGSQQGPKDETGEKDQEGQNDQYQTNQDAWDTPLYSQIPDVSVPTKDYGAEFADADPELVTWDGPDDPDDPRNWSFSSKVVVTLVVSVYTLVSPMSSSMLSPAIGNIASDIGMTSTVATLSISIMVLSWALGPLLIAPLSESDYVGRRPVLNVSIWVNFAFNLGCGFVKTPAQLCVLRFLGGLGGCAPMNVGAGALADIWSDEHRLVALAAYSIAPTLGPVLAPVISSFIVQNKSWHWVFYVLGIFNGFVAVVGTIFLRETYLPKLLRLKCQKLRKITKNDHLHTIFEIADGETTWGKISVQISRPIKLLVTHPMVLGLGVFMAFVYGFMYLMIVTFPDVFRGRYGFGVGIAGLMYLPMGIGYIVGTVFWTYAIQKIYVRMANNNGGVAKPEYRLPCLCFSGLGIPVGLICIGSAIFSFSFIAVFQTIQNYLIDMNNRFAASSIAAAAVFRLCFGFAFPLFAKQMYVRLDYGWGNTMCGLIALVLGLPFPVLCLVYGERIRQWANLRMDREQAQRDARNLERLQRMQVLG